MDKNAIRTIISEVMGEVLESDTIQLDESTTARDVDGWDSITHMMIINELENRLDIKFSLTELMNLNNIGDLVEIIGKKLS